MTLHNLEELDDDLGGGSDQDLALASLLGVVDGVERIVENGSADHFCGIGRRFSDQRIENEVSVVVEKSFVSPSIGPVSVESALKRSIARVLPPSAEEEKRIERGERDNVVDLDPPKAIHPQFLEVKPPDWRGPRLLSSAMVKGIILSKSSRSQAFE